VLLHFHPIAGAPQGEWGTPLKHLNLNSLPCTGRGSAELRSAQFQSLRTKKPRVNARGLKKRNKKPRTECSPWFEFRRGKSSDGQQAHSYKAKAYLRPKRRSERLAQDTLV
jgi:hypothetical protein